MKYFNIFFFTLICFFASAQQNFINVPSSEVTLEHKLFFQQQFNFNELIQSNTTLDYGLGKGFEVGLNILGLNFNQKQKSFLQNDTTDTDPYNPLVLLNGMKIVEVSKHFLIGTGIQLGMNYRDSKKRAGAALGYLNFRISDLWIKNSNLVGGLYFNSRHYGGKGNRLGAWLGTEIPLTSYFHFMAESVLGNNAISYTSLGIIAYARKWMPLTLGFQIPNTQNNSYSIIFELTIIPLAKKD